MSLTPYSHDPNSDEAMARQCPWWLWTADLARWWGCREVLDGHHLGRENLEIFEKPPDFFLVLSHELGVETDARLSLMVCVPLLIGGRISDYFRKVQSILEIGRTMLCLELRYKEALVVKNQLWWYRMVKSKPWWLEERVIWFLPFPTVDDRKPAKFIIKFILLFTIGFFYTSLQISTKIPRFLQDSTPFCFRNRLFYPTSLGGGIPWSCLNLRTGMGSFAHGDGDRYIGQWRWIFFCVTKAESI